jgi:hypothetical protein
MVDARSPSDLLHPRFRSCELHIWGQPIYYANEDRNLTDAEMWEVVGLLMFGGELFSFLGLVGVLYFPKG